MSMPSPVPGSIGRVGAITTTSGVTGLVAAALFMLQEFGIPFTVDQVLAVVTFVGLAVPFVVAVLTSRQATRAFLLGVGTDPGDLPTTNPGVGRAGDLILRVGTEPGELPTTTPGVLPAPPAPARPPGVRKAAEDTPS